MNKQIAGIVLAASVIGGVAAGATASAWKADGPPAAAPSSTSVAEPLPDIEVKKPILVMNDDGGATLSATLVNHTKRPVGLDRAIGGQKEDDDAPFLLVHGSRSNVEIGPGASMRIGGVDDQFRVRFTDRVQVGSTLPVTLYFGHGSAMANGPSVTSVAPVVTRSAAHSAVANNGPNSVISVHDAKIVVVPGQDKAYLGGWLESKIDDLTELRPTGVGRRGRPVEVLHQTATGGPSGVFVQAGQKMPLGYTSYLEEEGDRDYVQASDVEVGETIRVTIRFPSGDVVGKFKVVQGKADGTI